jgi:hypothetical protein
VTTIASSTATAIEIGMRTLRPSARLDAPTAVTNRISSVAYAVEEMASDENTASAIVLGIRWCSWSAEAMGFPTKTRLTTDTILASYGPVADGHLTSRQP